MTNLTSSKMHPIVYALRNIVTRFTQHPAIYPIKYYKKTSRLKRKRKMMAGY
jgi:UDP-N-acetylglucosamine 2-epimerase